MLNKIFLGVMNIIGNLKVNGGTVPYLIAQDLTTVGNDADLLEKTLNSVIVPANTLVNIGDKLHFYTWGSFNGSPNDKARRVYANNQLLLLKTGSPSNQDWVTNGYITKISDTQQKVSAATIQTNGTLCNNIIITEDLTQDLIIKTTGKNTAIGTANDITGEGLIVERA